MIESQLYLVKSYDPWSLLIVIFALANAVTVAASFLLIAWRRSIQ